MIQFFIVVNKYGQPRLAQYYGTGLTFDERVAQQSEIIRRCLKRSKKETSIFDFKDLKIIYRKYASLYFVCGVDDTENELSILELIHNIVETLDKHFEEVCELDLMFNLEQANYVLDEIILNGAVVETSKKNILQPLKY